MFPGNVRFGFKRESACSLELRANGEWREFLKLGLAAFDDHVRLFSFCL